MTAQDAADKLVNLIPVAVTLNVVQKTLDRSTKPLKFKPIKMRRK